jgi:hypothetical protein
LYRTDWMVFALRGCLNPIAQGATRYYLWARPSKCISFQPGSHGISCYCQIQSSDVEPLSIRSWTLPVPNWARSHLTCSALLLRCPAMICPHPMNLETVCPQISPRPPCDIQMTIVPGTFRRASLSRHCCIRPPYRRRILPPF